MRFQRRQFGALRCAVVDASAQAAPTLLVVLNHGFGASGEDLVDLAPMLVEEDEDLAQAVRFVFPEAPVDLGAYGMPGGRAWWPINMERLAEINQTRNFDELMNLKPPGMESASVMLKDSIRAMMAEWSLGEDRLVLGGFSQGAMVSTQVTLEFQMVPSLLTLFSGTLLNRIEWADQVTRHRGCRVLQSHGYQDPILPFAPAEQLRDMLSGGKFQVEFLPFHGQHSIPMAVLSRLQSILTELVQKKTE